MKNIFNTPKETAEPGQLFNLLTDLRVLHDNEHNRYDYPIPTWAWNAAAGLSYFSTGSGWVQAVTANLMCPDRPALVRRHAADKTSAENV